MPALDAAGLAGNAAEDAARLGIYRRLIDAQASGAEGGGANTYYFTLAASLLASGVDTALSNGPAGLYIAAADWAIPGRTPLLRIRGVVAANATDDTITHTFGLYPVTWSGGSNLLIPTMGVVVPGSTAAVDSGVNGVTKADSTDFAVPADGFYALGVVFSGTQAANASATLYIALELKHA